MVQLGLFSQPIWTITEITQYLRELLTEDQQLQDVWVQGEISNFSRPSSGHLYFTLKDAGCALRCVMWRSAAMRLSQAPRDGESVEVHGKIDIYEAQGQYQLYADLLRPFGEGALYQEFMRLKSRLEAEGLFAAERKRPIPRWPRCIGIVTSPTGAALRDILNTLRRRYPLTEVVVAPTAVQGEEAPPGIVSALEALNRLVKPDVILLARGGGSMEDLWAFNDERVARAMAASQAPIVSGVGHETDFTIADFVSDLRAPTPTASAELVTPNKEDLLDLLDNLVSRQGRAIHALLTGLRLHLQRLDNRLVFLSPQARIRSDRQRLDEYAYRLQLGCQHHLLFQRTRLQNLEGRLHTLNPTAVLQRGYAIVSRADGSVVRNTNQVRADDLLDVQVSDGTFSVTVQHPASD
jgi:exodeoxyribonuclease VII large subunit